MATITPDKLIRLKRIRRASWKLKRRYGFGRCPEHLRDTFDEVRRALKERAVEIIEAK